VLQKDCSTQIYYYFFLPFFFAFFFAIFSPNESTHGKYLYAAGTKFMKFCAQLFSAENNAHCFQWKTIVH